MIKKVNTDYPIHELIENRWSPYKFLPDRLIPKEDLFSLLEAARWAPSSYNEQPWRFIIAPKEQIDEFEKLLSCLVKANKEWAKNSSVLMLGITHLTFDRNGKENKAAMNDLGAAVSHLSFEATTRGISVHQMIGIEPQKAREAYAIPENFEVLIAIAIGYPDLNETANDTLAIRDRTPRVRKTISEVVFFKEWGSAFV
jgi:nitroreductase